MRSGSKHFVKRGFLAESKTAFIEVRENALLKRRMTRGLFAPVALHAEDVDGNMKDSLVPIVGEVALHAEGVDGNQLYKDQINGGLSRPPCGGRGLKYIDLDGHMMDRAVAFHAEGVDGNTINLVSNNKTVVALHAEGVDGNNAYTMRDDATRRRPPCGGRGLKWDVEVWK